MKDFITNLGKEFYNKGCYDVICIIERLVNEKIMSHYNLGDIETVAALHEIIDLILDIKKEIKEDGK